MQKHSRQTLLPGLKLSYDHPHFIPLSLFPITPPTTPNSSRCISQRELFSLSKKSCEDFF